MITYLNFFKNLLIDLLNYWPVQYILMFMSIELVLLLTKKLLKGY